MPPPLFELSITRFRPALCKSARQSGVWPNVFCSAFDHDSDLLGVMIPSSDVVLFAW